MRTGYSTADAARAVEMSERQVRYLATHGLVRASILHTAGRGSPALYAYGDLLKLAAIQRIRLAVAADTTLDRLRAVSGALERAGATTERGQMLVMDEQTAWLEPDGLQTVLADGRAVIVLSLDALDEQLRLKLRREGLADRVRATKAA